MRTRLQKVVGLAAFVVLALGANATAAHANVIVCNNYQSEIRFAATINDTPSCSGSWREAGWWIIPAGQCRTLVNPNFPANMTGKTIWTYARATDGSFEWTGSSSWLVPNSGHNGCQADFQLSCTNAGANCTRRSHRGSVVNSPDVTITYQR